ncbi:MAG TPA: SdrD B-like domain-containing protein, partial [Candidatus Anammoximicrobium sp.]|nr:SdrD B-like domain-containing protein [Candidatus Anammoximicrobium sp.]
FGDLTGSDKAGFEIKYSDGTTLAKFYQDYITSSGTANAAAGYSGFQSLGFAGGDGSWVAGSTTAKTWLKDFDSTLELNLNRVGYTGYTTNSPLASDPLYGGWDAINGYMFTISAAAFADKGFGGVAVFDQHNSPAKTGDSNSLLPVVVGGDSVNVATATGTGNRITVSASDDALVVVIPGPLGSLGDRVWFDTNANGRQDTGEPGLAGVTVCLAGDINNDGSTEYTATATTDSNGIYQFAGLPAGGYTVTVDTATLPANFVATYDLDGLELSPNEAVGELASGQNRTDLDFGYVASAPGFSLVKTADKAVAAPNESVTYTYTVTNTGAAPLTQVAVRDDNATPDYAADDFNPTYVSGDLNNNAVLDVNEVWQYTATVIPPVKMTVDIADTTYESGTLSYQTLTNGDIRVFYRQSMNFNDNTYGTATDAGWDGDIHKFGDLTGSDKAGFEVKYADGTTLVKFYQDYITASGTANPAAGYSGFQSLGYTGGDGSLVSGNGAVLKDFDSTLELNLNRAGYTGYTVNSPMPSDPQYAGWEAINGYLFTISAAAFASKGFGGVTVFDQHNSPAKTGSSNSLIPVVTEDESVNTAVVSAQLGGGTVVAIADAHVRIGQAATGAKFFVVDTGVDDMFRYSASGAEVGSFTLQSGNTDPRGLAADADGTRLWVLDKDKNVNVYSADGSPAGLWKADGLGKEPEGIALDGSDLWIVDRGAKKIFWFDEAASRTSGTVRATTTFAYSSVLNAPKGIVTDGTRLWLVNDGAPDKVFVYTIARDGTGAPTALT